MRGHVAEGRSRFELVVAHSANSAAPVRASALSRGASFAYRQGDLLTAKGWWEESLELYRALGETSEIGRCLGELGSVAFGEGDVERAQSLYQESADVFERENVAGRLAIVLANLAAIETLRGDLDGAASHAGRAATLQRERGDSDDLSVTLHNLARIYVAQGRIEEGRAALQESIELARSLDYPEVLAYGLETSGELAFASGDRERAGRLLGACDSAVGRLGVAMATEEEEGYARVLGGLREQLGDERVDELLAEGRAAPFEASVRSALELLASSPGDSEAA